MILMTYRHGLRVSELIGLQWSQVDFDHQVLHVSRVKGSKASTQPLQGDTLRALRWGGGTLRHPETIAECPSHASPRVMNSVRDQTTGTC
jgi:Phage integrase family